MTDTEIEAYRQRLNTLTAQCSNEEQEKTIRPELQELAREVGASRWVLYVSGDKHMTGEADTSILIHNIHQALQTASMANMCGRAREGYKIATQTSKWAVKASRRVSIQFWIAAAIAIISAVAAWVAAIKT